MNTHTNSLPELLAPAGNYDSFIAAIHAKADAIYFGLNRFNARIRANNLDLSELKELILIAKSKKIRTYLTLNVLISENEFASALELALDVISLGVDGLIIQDWGLMYYLKQFHPQIKLHASTQCTSHNSAQLSWLANYDIQQLNLSRELNLMEIKELSTFAHSLNQVCEVFVFGAYCISFSGQCHLSGFESGHSSNRGSCIQACRRNYSSAETKKAGLFLNLKDNNAIASVEQLIMAGVGSLKIEGRRKSWQYVYTVVKTWRSAIDHVIGHEPVLYDTALLYKIFNRGFSTAYLDGAISKNMFAKFSGNAGLKLLGKIVRYDVQHKIIVLDQKHELNTGDTLACYLNSGDFIASLVVINTIDYYTSGVSIEGILRGKILPGMNVYIQQQSMADPQILLQHLDKQLIALKVIVSGRLGDKMQSWWEIAEFDINYQCDSQLLLETSTKHSLNSEYLLKQWSRLDNYELSLVFIDCEKLDNNVYLPVSELNRMRRKAITTIENAIENHRIGHREATIIAHKPSIRNLQLKTISLDCSIALCDNLEYVKELLKNSTFELIFLEIPLGNPVLANSLSDTLWQVQIDNPHISIGPWFSIAIFEAELTLASQILDRHHWKLICTENSGIAHIASQKQIPWLAGPGMNICNNFALNACLSRGALGAIASTELSIEQFTAIIQSEHYQTAIFSAKLYGPQLLMTSRQCLIRNVAECSKVLCDDQCLPDCHREIKIANESKNKYYLIKSKGFQTRMYSDAVLFAPEMYSAIKKLGSSIFFDFRIATKTGLSISDLKNWHNLFLGLKMPRPNPSDQGMWLKGLKE